LVHVHRIDFQISWSMKHLEFCHLSFPRVSIYEWLEMPYSWKYILPNLQPQPKTIKEHFFDRACIKHSQLWFDYLFLLLNFVLAYKELSAHIYLLWSPKSLITHEQYIPFHCHFYVFASNSLSIGIEFLDTIKDFILVFDVIDKSISAMVIL
jgi:hypothetical protein